MLELLAAVVVRTADPSAPRVEVASPDECAVIVAVGKAKMGWGDKPPTNGLKPDTGLPGGGVYRATCPWRSLGVANPILAGPSPGFAIDRPTFDAARTHATASLAIFVAARAVEVQTCRLEKIGGRWRIASCDSTLLR